MNLLSWHQHWMCVYTPQDWNAYNESVRALCYNGFFCLLMVFEDGRKSVTLDSWSKEQVEVRPVQCSSIRSAPYECPEHERDGEHPVEHAL